MTSKTAYIVLCGWRDEAGRFHVHADYDTADIRFADGSVWNDDTSEWERDDDLSEALHHEVAHGMTLAGIWHDPA